MPSIKSETHREPARQNEALELNVFLVHEDVASALRAKRALDRIAGHPGLETAFRVKLWNFSLLEDPALQAGLAEEARRSDIVLLSAGGCRELPFRIYAWIEECLRCRVRDPLAFIVSLDAAARDFVKENPLVKRIRAIARRTGADFFAHYDAAPSEEENPAPKMAGAEPRSRWIDDGATAQW